MNVTIASLILEIDGETVMALIDSVDKNLLVQTVAMLTDTGRLKVVRMGREYQWAKFEKHDTIEVDA